MFLLSTRPLEECEDIDASVFRSLTASLARHLGVDLFGFDALIESETKNVFVVDVNFLPGFKGKFQYRNVQVRVLFVLAVILRR